MRWTINCKVIRRCLQKTQQSSVFKLGSVIFNSVKFTDVFPEMSGHFPLIFQFGQRLPGVCGLRPG